MKRFARTFLLLASLFSFGAWAADNTKVEPVAPINIKDDLALRGYDAVSYFTDGEPRVGSPRYEIEWQGARWRFASPEHLASFKADPTRYAPQYGGYCALAMSLGRIADGDPRQWAVVDSKLFLNNNPKAKAKWDEDRPRNIVLGDKNWPSMPKKSIGSQSDR